MKYLFLLPLLLLVSLPAFSQSDTSASKKKAEIYMLVENIPYCEGCADKLVKNIRYPKKAQELNLSGTVVAGLLIQKDGKMNNIRILNALHPDCDREVLKALSKLNNWQPASHNGEAVAFEFRIPVHFMQHKGKYWVEVPPVMEIKRKKGIQN